MAQIIYPLQTITGGNKMITIITAKKIIKWNYKRLLKNLYNILAIIFFIVAYLYLSNQDYLTLINK